MTEIRLTVPRDVTPERPIQFREPRSRIAAFLGRARIDEAPRVLVWDERDQTCTIARSVEGLQLDGIQSICKPGDEVRIAYDKAREIARFVVLDGAAVILRHIVSVADDNMRPSIRRSVPLWFFHERDIAVDEERRHDRREALLGALTAMLRSEVSRLSVYGFARVVRKSAGLQVAVEHPEGMVMVTGVSGYGVSSSVEEFVSLVESIASVLDLSDDRIGAEGVREVLRAAAGLSESNAR